MTRSNFILILSLLISTVLSGCLGVNPLSSFAPAEIVRHPDAPMLIMEARDGYIRTAVYDSTKNELIQYGWIKIKNSEMRGWTLMKYDWEAFIKKRGESRDDN